MNLKDFLKVLVFFSVGIFLFMMLFIPPFEWESIINYFIVTSFWSWIGEAGFLVLTALAFTAGYFFIEGLIS